MTCGCDLTLSSTTNSQGRPSPDTTGLVRTFVGAVVGQGGFSACAGLHSADVKRNRQEAGGGGRECVRQEPARWLEESCRKEGRGTC